MDAEQSRELDSLLRLRPELSDREVARMVGVTHPTVGKRRRKLAIPPAEGVQFERVLAMLAHWGDGLTEAELHAKMEREVAPIRAAGLGRVMARQAEQAAALLEQVAQMLDQEIVRRAIAGTWDASRALPKAAQIRKGGSRTSH